jgi:Flp pilus assembly protein protease CpaA
MGITFFFFIYLDIKFRRIPHWGFIFSYIIGITLNFFEFLIFFEKITLIIFLKIFLLIFVFSLSFILFVLKIIGGSDGKLFIFIFFVHPILLLNMTFIFSFFLFFSLFFILYFMVNLIFNSIFGDNFSFNLFFNLNIKLSTFKKAYFKSFYRFFNYSDLYDYIERKYYIKSLNLLYNFKKKKFQILCQIRPPLIVLIILSYYIIFFLN